MPVESIAEGLLGLRISGYRTLSDMWVTHRLTPEEIARMDSLAALERG